MTGMPIVTRPGFLTSGIAAVLGVILTLVGLSLFPRPSTSPRPQPSSVFVYAFDDAPITLVEYRSAAEGESEYRVQLTVWIADAPGGHAPKHPQVTFKLPPGQKFHREHDAYKRFGVWWLDTEIPIAPAGEIYNGSRAFEIEGSNPGFAVDGEHVVAVRPEIGGTTDDDTNVSVTYAIPHSAELEWQQNPPDSSTGRANHWDYLWTRYGVGESTAVNVTREGDAQFQGFLAAALFALGLSSVFVIIPELMKELLRKPKTADPDPDPDPAAKKRRPRRARHR